MNSLLQTKCASFQQVGEIYCIRKKRKLFSCFFKVILCFYPGYISIGQSQDSFPIRPIDEEAVWLDDGGDVGAQGGVGAMGHRHQVSAQLSLPATLGVRDVNTLTLVMVRAGAGNRHECCRENTHGPVIRINIEILLVFNSFFVKRS